MPKTAPKPQLTAVTALNPWCWVFSRTPAGVHVTTEESFAGEPVQSDVTGMQSALDGSLAAWLGLRCPEASGQSIH